MADKIRLRDRDRCTALEMEDYPRSRTNKRCRLPKDHPGLHETWSPGINRGHYQKWGPAYTIKDLMRERERERLGAKP